MHSPKQIKLNIAMFYLVQFLTGALFTIPVWVAYERGFLTYPQMALLESAGFIVGILFEIPSSAFADLVGRKRTVFLGWLISGLSYIYIGASNNLPGLIIGIIGSGIGGAFVSGADTALIYDFLKANNKENSFVKINVFSNIFYRAAIIFATFTAGFLSLAQLNYGYLLRGIFLILALFPIAFMIEVPFKKEKLTTQRYFNQIKQGYKNIVQNPYIRDVVIYYSFIAAITWSCLYYFNNTFANDAGYTPSGQGNLFTLIYIITTSVLLYITNFTKLVENTKLVLYAFPILLIFGLLPGVFATKASAFIMLIPVVLAGGARFSVLDGLLNKLLESKDRATTLSTINMFVNIIFITLVLVGGQVQNMYSSKLMFTLMGLLSLFVVMPYTRIIVKRYKL